MIIRRLTNLSMLGLPLVVIFNLINVPSLVSAAGYYPAQHHHVKHIPTKASACLQQCNSFNPMAISAQRKVLEREDINGAEDEIPFYVALMNFGNMHDVSKLLQPVLKIPRPPDILILYSIFRF